MVTSGHAIEDEIWRQVNEYRRSQKLPPLTLNNTIAGVARTHSLNMASLSVPFGHDGFNNRAKQLEQKIAGLRAVAEKVAFGQRTASEVVADWLSSPGHRANIVGNYTQTGIGVVANKKGVLYYTQMFVR